MKSGFLNIISELMERKLFSYVPIFEAELERMLRPYDVLRNYCGSFKEDGHFPSDQGSNQKRFGHFINLCKY